jgi:PAS domain S-box-containing protein
MKQMRQIWTALLNTLRVIRSIRGKLAAVLLVTTGISLLVVGTFLTAYEVNSYRSSWRTDLGTEASILALSMGPALAFDDREVATRNLEALQARPEIAVAALYDARGVLYARYQRAGATPAAPHLSLAGNRIAGQVIEYTLPLMQNGEHLGTLYLRAHYDLTGRLLAYFGILVLAAILGMAVALLLTTALQHVVTQPLDEIVRVAQQIQTGRDYSTRARHTTHDELAVVIDAFNSMLDEIEARTHEQEHTNAELRREAQVRQTAEQALARTKIQLESTMAAAEIGTWLWDLSTNTIEADRNLAALYGVDDVAVLSGDPARHRQRIHPDDLDKVVASETDALRSGKLTSTEFRIIRPDGSIRWLASRGRLHLDRNGVPSMLSALKIDITAQKLAERALQDSERLYRAIGESMDYGVWVCDAAGRNVYSSDSFLKLAGITQQECAGFNWTEILHPDDREATAAAWNACVRRGDLWYREHRVRGADGQYHAVLAQGVPIRDERGVVTGWAGFNLDIHRLKDTEMQLREAGRRKDEFLATLAHELRNPLAPIRHAVKLLQASGVEESKLQWARAVIARQVERMALLLDDLLDVARITRGRLQLSKSTVHLDQLVAMAVETARPLIESKHQTLLVGLPHAPVELRVDPLRASQALGNVLTNAAKYTDQGGRIELNAHVDDQSLTIAVKDSGIGLSAESFPGLFEMFSQVDSVSERTDGGLGIGLALVKGLMELHGGSVNAASEGLGRGSVFTLQFPGSIVAAPVAAATAPRLKPRNASQATTAVVVVDDNRDAADSLAMLLSLSDYEVDVAYSGQQGLELCARVQPRIVILDIGMPFPNGYEVAQRIREQDWGREALLVAVTGWGQESDRIKTRAAGFDHHLTKPIDIEELQQLLQEFLVTPI